MKTVLLSMIVSVCMFAGADEKTATYIVPVPAELAEYSRFEVGLIERYSGDASDSVSYSFPEEPTGKPNLIVHMTRVPGTQNNWDGPEMSAYCTENSEQFTCNMYLKKTAQAVFKK